MKGGLLFQGLLELMQEDELDKIISQRLAYENVRKFETERLRKLQEQQEKIVKENAREVAEQIKLAEEAVAIGTQISAALFVKSYMKTLMSTSMDAARKDGTLRDQEAGMTHDVTTATTSILQWVQSAAEEPVHLNIITRAILDGTDQITSLLTLFSIFHALNIVVHKFVAEFTSSR